MTPAQLLAHAEADFERATRRRELAAAIAADWPYWAPLLNGAHGGPEATAPAETAAAVLATPEAPQSACVECGAALPPKTGLGRRPTRCASCRQPPSNGHEPGPLAELKPEAPPPSKAQDYTVDWLAPPKLPWQERGEE